MLRRRGLWIHDLTCCSHASLPLLLYALSSGVWRVRRPKRLSIVVTSTSSRYSKNSQMSRLNPLHSAYTLLHAACRNHSSGIESHCTTKSTYVWNAGYAISRALLEPVCTTVSNSMSVTHIFTSAGNPTSSTFWPFLISLNPGIFPRLISSALWLMTGSICMLATATTVSPLP